MSCGCGYLSQDVSVLSALLDKSLLLVLIFFSSHRKLKKAINPNVTVVDPTAVLDPQIDNIRKEFQKLVNRLKRKLAGDPDAEEESLEGTKTCISFTTPLNETLTPILLRCCPALELLEEIKMLNESMSLNDERLSDATKALEDSMDTREMVKFNLSSCSDKEDLAQLDMDLEDLNVTSLNGKVRSQSLNLWEERHLTSHSWWLFTHSVH